MAEIKTQTLDSYLRLIEISRDLASTLDLDTLLNDIVRASADITHAEAASILLYDDTSRQLYFQVSTNIDEPTMRGFVVPIEKSIAGWVVSNHKSVRIDDAHQDLRHFSDIEQSIGFNTQSLLGIPLITKNKVVGVLEVLNKKRGKFGDADESMLSVLGAQAAVAIENARLFQQSDLIAEFVHELRTPLASLSTATYLLLRPEMSLEQRDQMVNNIHNENSALELAGFLVPRPGTSGVGPGAVPPHAFQRGGPVVREPRRNDDQGPGNERPDPYRCAQRYAADGSRP